MQQSLNPGYSRGVGSGMTGFFGLNLKTIISFFIIIEAMTAIILFAMYLYFFNSIAENLGTQQADGKAIAAFLLAIMSYLLWKTMFASYTTLNFVRNSDYQEISANRYLFIALSLSLGGMWTPFILTALPNTNVQSTINPRYFLVKTYGTISAIGGLIAIGVYFIALTVGVNALSSDIIFQSHTTINSLTIVNLALSLTLSAFGFLSLWSWKQGKKDNFATPDDSSLFKFISTVWLVIVTCEVALTLLYAVVRFLGILSQTFDFISQSRGTAGMPSALFLLPILMMNIAIQLLYVLWIGYIVYQTINGLWQPHVSYRTYESLARFEQRRAKAIK